MSAHLALGTAQFGLDYGVNNKRGRIPPGEAAKILRYAWENDIRVLDSAWEYQESEAVIGEFIQKEKAPFKIVSKLPTAFEQNVIEGFEASLARLKLSKMHGYLVHHIQTFIEHKNILDDLLKLKRQGKVEKIGFSLYHTQDLEYLLVNHVPFDLLQVPLSILDQRFLPFFSKLKEKNIEIHVRSIF